MTSPPRMIDAAGLSEAGIEGTLNASTSEVAAAASISRSDRKVRVGGGEKVPSHCGAIPRAQKSSVCGSISLCSPATLHT